MSAEPPTVRGLISVNHPTWQRLTARQQTDYAEFKRGLITWLLTNGKDPAKAKGYAESTVRQVTQKTDHFYRWKWNQDGYTTRVDSEDADGYVRHLMTADEEYSNGHLASTQKCLQRLYTYRAHELDAGAEWEPQHTFTQSATQPRDFLTIEERQQIREAALEYGSIPAYNGLSAGERREWKRYLAQRFKKPLDDVTLEDWDRANGWKIPSLVWTSLDTGLRPIEVERATVQWVDVENRVLRIPKSDSSKNRENWLVSITDRTATALDKWLDERPLYDIYDDTAALWLTREANPYTPQALKYVLTRLCDIAAIPTEHRRMSWYTIRHSLGTYMTREADLAAAQAQLRHKSPETTMRYDQTPVEDRREALTRL